MSSRGGDQLSTEQLWGEEVGRVEGRDSNSITGATTDYGLRWLLALRVRLTVDAWKTGTGCAVVRPANHRYQYTDSGFAEIEQERVGLRRAQAGPPSVDSTAAVNHWTTDGMRVRSLLQQKTYLVQGPIEEATGLYSRVSPQ